MARYEEAIINITKLLDMIARMNNPDIVDAYFDSLDGQAGCVKAMSVVNEVHLSGVNRSMSRARDICDQLVGLCECAEVDLKSNPNPGDLISIQKSIVLGFFMNATKLSCNSAQI
ncbi:HA2-domain-containing protein [Gigaspora margarita]|uniref:HA2-domain-containing protein n=1 Tax=Gigaspora margarita TaxID=4874 RepID=A0A8H3X216_GIGMA|nr:HA2-domain-containing protein [Gigaspora margarita]